MTEKVTTLPVRTKTGKVIEVVHSSGGCPHVRATVNEKLADLTCSDCGVKLNPIQFLVTLANKLTMWDYQASQIKKVRAELDERKRCRCTKCGEWTEIRRVHNREAARLKSSAPDS